MDYTINDFINAYVETLQPSYSQGERKIYAEQRLKAFEQAVRIHLSFEGVRNQSVKPLWMLFRATVNSLLAIRTPRSGFLDDSLINVILERLGEQATQLHELETTIHDLANYNQALHRKLLVIVFDLLWGPVDFVVTSKQLRSCGFDDTKPIPYDNPELW